MSSADWLSTLLRAWAPCRLGAIARARLPSSSWLCARRLNAATNVHRRRKLPNNGAVVDQHSLLICVYATWLAARASDEARQPKAEAMAATESGYVRCTLLGLNMRTQNRVAVQGRA